MSSDRWRQVEDLCHAALARRAEERRPFLVQACEGDEALLREVESLIAQESSAEAFMRVPAAALAGSIGFEQPRAALVGARFGSYTIRSLLGVGGMGEVYRAQDDTLGREVAIKLLSPAFTAEPERRARFEREARMLATLNHPHIGAIYGVEEADGVRGLILELVEGVTLAERITASARTAGSDPRALPMTDALTIARQIVDALEAAHEKGIVHRDLKPANIKITPDGVVKVLDFGLAKVASPDSSGSDLTHSRAGAIFGTAAYMSPEQARGHNVDKRADIWAFGCVLFEMLTGRVAFAGETASDTIAKILEREPDWSVLPAATPARIRQLLVRCLAKDPKQRLRDIGDVGLEMDSADDALPSVSDATMASSARAKTGTTWLPWLAFAALLAGVAVWEARRAPIVQESPLANAQFSYFTDWDGTEGGAEISPDGRFVAFKADRDGQVDLWVKQVDAGIFRNLTQDVPPLSLPGGVVRTFGFNGDGSEIWFAEGGDSSGPKWLIPVTGGTRRALLGKADAAPSWSREGTRLAYFTNGHGDPISIADQRGVDARPLIVDTPGFFAGTMHNHNPAWSSNDQWIYFAHGPDAKEEMNVWRVRPSGGTPEQLTALRAAANHLAVIDQHTVLYVALAEDGSGPWLWSLDVETKATRRVISGVEHYSSVSASRNGRRVVTTVSNPTASLWRVPLLLDRQAEDSDVQPYALPSARALSPRFSRTALFYLSGQGAGAGLWRFQDGNPFEVWKAATANDSLSEPAAVSPDGTRVAIIVRQQGTLRLLMMSADGTNARTLAPSIAIQSSGGYGSADWSPNGASIVAAGTDAQGPGLFTIPVDGRTPVRLVSGQAINPVWSPDGTVIVYGGPSVGGQVPLLGVRPDGARVELPDVRTGLGGGHRFLPNGKGLVYMPRTQSRDFWLLDLATNKTHVLAHLSDHGAVSAFDITPDGKAIVFDRLRDNSDIVLIDLPK
jgi:Tol biopolymer transport system component